MNDIENNSKNLNKKEGRDYRNIIIVILVVLLIFVLAYICYQEIFIKKDNNGVNDNSTSNSQKEDFGGSDNANNLSDKDSNSVADLITCEFELEEKDGDYYDYWLNFHNEEKQYKCKYELDNGQTIILEAEDDLTSEINYSITYNGYKITRKLSYDVEENPALLNISILGEYLFYYVEDEENNGFYYIVDSNGKSYDTIYNNEGIVKNELYASSYELNKDGFYLIGSKVLLPFDLIYNGIRYDHICINDEFKKLNVPDDYVVEYRYYFKYTNNSIDFSNPTLVKKNFGELKKENSNYICS